MKILVTGKNGQLGSAFLQQISNNDVIGLSRAELDLSKPQDISKILAYHQPDIILNAAAYTAVDTAESEQKLAFNVNADAVYEMGQYASKNGVILYHYSTDYVFDGELNRPYLETDVANPLSVYGQSKLAGEKALTATGAQYCIFRTSWVYSRTGHNFIKTMLHLLPNKKELNIVNDQIGAPTSANLIADVSLKALKNKLSSGIYHLSTSGCTSWFELAHYIADYFYDQEILNKIKPISSANYVFIAKRPLNSRLNTAKLEQQLKCKLPQWQDEFNYIFENYKKELLL